jgi:SAM-dependent methyltransferase
VKEASALYRLLGDEGRLRLLRVLGRERLNVTELTGVLGLAQSGISRHLGLLKEAGLVQEEKDGGFSYYRLAPPLAAGRDDPLSAMLDHQFTAAAGDPMLRADDARLHEVLRLRKENFEAWSRALGLLLPPLRVADLGCGEGYLTVEAARWASRVIAVDRSDAVLRRAHGLAERRRVANVIWKRGELEHLPIGDGEVDVAMLSQALHHAHDPARAVAEAVRVTAPGGRVLVLDLRTHRETWVHSKLGDRVLGFGDAELKRMLMAAGLGGVRVGIGARRTGDPFTVLVACGVKPGAQYRQDTKVRKTATRKK